MSTQTVTPQVLIDTGASRLWVVPNYTADIYDQVKTIFTYEEPPIVVFGKQARQHRDVAFYSDESQGYRYSGQIMTSLPLSQAPILQYLLPQINQSVGTNFNGILVNRYRNGEKYIGPHSDDEKALDKNRKIVLSLCYGPGIRTFRIRDKKSKQIVLDVEHLPCMLLAMEGNFQSEFTHEIPIQKKVIGERISLTFRHHTE